MTFKDFPASLPYLEVFHDNDALDKLIDELPRDEVVELEIADQAKELHPFIDALDKMEDLIKLKNVTFTENMDITHSTTNDACLDLFYSIEKTGEQQIELLENAWKQDRDLTLHIIFYARSIHRGKGLKLPFFTAFCWLLQKNPKTAIRNLVVLIKGTIKSSKKQQEGETSDQDWDMLNELKEGECINTKPHGCWKDLGTILTIYCQGELKGPQSDTYKALFWPRTQCENIWHREANRNGRYKRWEARKKMDKEKRAEEVKYYIELDQERKIKEKEEAHEERLRTRQKRNQHVSYLLTEDKVYQALHAVVARLFADQLRADMIQLDINKKKVMEGLDTQKYALSNNLSLAAKWAPSLKHSHDKNTFLATSIAEILFPPGEYQNENETRTYYLNKVRELYRKNWLHPLRTALDLTEHHMFPGKWDEIDYSHVPSICLKNNIGHFFKHSPDNVVEYMRMVQKGKKKVSGSTLTPNQLVYKIYEPEVPQVIAKMPDLVSKFAEVENNMVNGQWDTLINSIRDIGSTDSLSGNHIGLAESIAVCDVSGSMFSGGYSNKKPEEQPIYAAIGLSLVISNLTKPPFNGHVISFTDIPSLLSPDTNLPFSEQVKVIKDSRQGFSTNLRAVFINLLLPMAKKYNLKQSDMVKRIFVFSDMEFDCSYTGGQQFMTTYESIRDEYKKAGYEMPELVWWNLSNTARQKSIKAPVTKDHKGVCLLGGYSSSMLKTFLDGETPDINDSMEITKEDDKKNLEVPEKKKKDTETEKKLDPIDFMKQAVYHESFQSLKVFI